MMSSLTIILAGLGHGSVATMVVLMEHGSVANMVRDLVDVLEVVLDDTKLSLGNSFETGQMDYKR